MYFYLRICREKIERMHIEFVDNGTRMSYREQRTHTFVPEVSNGSLEDVVFVPNILILVSTYTHTHMYVRTYTRASCSRVLRRSVAAQDNRSSRGFVARYRPLPTAAADQRSVQGFNRRDASQFFVDTLT